MHNNCYFPHLPVFISIANAIKSWHRLDKLKHIIFVCVQHELATTINLFESLVNFGTDPKNIYLLGKYYSSCDDVANKLVAMGINRCPYSKSTMSGEFKKTFDNDVRKLWQLVVDKLTNQSDIHGIVIIDDGGRCIDNTPQELVQKYPILAVEQTTGGLIELKNCDLNIPIIEVASSAAKLWIESPMIAGAAIREKLEKILAINKPNCGVIGTGYVGQAVTEKILSLQCKVFGFDINKKNISEHDNYLQCHSKMDVIEKADYIFGCTGYDITFDFNLEDINDDKKFFSCSSEDKEFLTLLRKIQPKNNNIPIDPLFDISYKTNSGKRIELIRGGFPITFDGGCQPAPVEDIQITQGLLLCAALQALEVLPDKASDNKKYRLKLNSAIQQFVSLEWAKSRKIIDDQLQITLNKFNDISWIKANSGGEYLLCKDMEKYFGKNYP